MKTIFFFLMLFSVMTFGQSVIVYTGSVTDGNYTGTLTTGGTATIGGDLITSGIINSGKTTTQIDGNIVALNTSWDDVQGTVSRHTSGSSGFPAFVEDSCYLTFTIDSTTASRSVVYQSYQFPHMYKEGTKIYPHIHYKYTTAQGTPTFVINYKWVNIDANENVPFAKYILSATTNTTNGYQALSTNATGMTGTGKTISSILVCQIWLRTTTAATKTCFVYSIDFHIEKDGIGSNTETSK